MARNSHTNMLQLSKAFGGRLGLWKTKRNDPSKRLLSYVVKNQRSKAKGYDLQKHGKTHTWRKTGVNTTMKMSTKGPNEDYARLSCQLQSEMARNSHTNMLQLSKAFGGRLGLWKTKRNDPSKRLLSYVVKNQRSKAKGYDLQKHGKTHTWRKTGVNTTMKMSTKGPNEDYARLSCQLKERPQLVCQKRISNGFVHLPWLLFLFSLLLTSLILSLY